MTKIIMSLNVLVFSTLLIACSSAPDQEADTTVVEGGIVGNALGDSTSAFVGAAAVGALAGNHVGKNLDEEDNP